MLMFLLLFSVARYLSAQVMGFEDGIPAGFRCDGNGNLALTSLYYKEGTKCLEWNYKPGSALYIPLESPLELTSKVNNDMALRCGCTMKFLNRILSVSNFFLRIIRLFISSGSGWLPPVGVLAGLVFSIWRVVKKERISQAAG